MLLETDYNWRVDAALGGASRAVADIGSHWCDTVQFVTGRRITEVMADLSIVWPTRKASVAGNQTFTTTSGQRMRINRSLPKTLARCCFALMTAAKAVLTFRRSVPGVKTA
jgi:predicted dehydrogenase